MLSTQQLTLLGLAVSGVVVSASLVEAGVLSIRNRHTDTPFDWHEFMLSLADLVGRKLIALLPLPLTTAVLNVVWHYRIHTLALSSVVAVPLLFLVQEFCYYWYHRASHRIRFLWATHAVHHSPNQLTLSTAFRLGWTGRLTGAVLFFTPLVWLGMRLEVVLATLTLNLLYQFWLHTTWIPKLGWLEYVFNTPSAHRVHHASNLAYLDANYGGVLVVFDRLFGTYVEERAEEPCRYGLVTPTRSHNPFVVELEHWASLARDIASAKDVGTAAGYLLRPPGWKPGGASETTEDLRRRAGMKTAVAAGAD